MQFQQQYIRNKHQIDFTKKEKRIRINIIHTYYNENMNDIFNMPMSNSGIRVIKNQFF